MASLNEIAEKLGLSTATVSRALNDKPGVNDETRKRVLELAADLNYTPNSAARSLALSSTHTIGFLSVDHNLPLAGDPFYLRIMRGAEQELSRRGYFLLVSTLYEDLQDASNLQLLREKRVDGLILAGPFFAQRFILSLKATGIPFILIDNNLTQTPVNCVMAEDERGSYTATAHLLEHGHRQIACLIGPTQWASSRARASGYRHAMEDANLTPHLFFQPETTADTGYAAMREALEQFPEMTAAFCNNDAMAFGAIKAAKDCGRSLPKDLALIGFDDVESARHSFPALTTLNIPKHQMGVLAARRLIDLIDNPEEAPTATLVAAELILRASCGCKPHA